jgi:hypothetical protein
MSTSLSPVDKPLAWIGSDRLLLNDVTIYGLRRKVLARKGDIPNMVGLLEVAYQEARNAKVHHWLFDKDGFYYLWIVWKVG